MAQIVVAQACLQAKAKKKPANAKHTEGRHMNTLEEEIGCKGTTQGLNPGIGRRSIHSQTGGIKLIVMENGVLECLCW